MGCIEAIAQYSVDARDRVRFCFFFFQAEDGIRDLTVTGVQTCALPISRIDSATLNEQKWPINVSSPISSSGMSPCRLLNASCGLPERHTPSPITIRQIGRASCRERV